MDEQTPLEEVEKNAAPSPQAVLYRPAPSVEERRAAGLAAREACPIASLGTWKQRASSDTAVDLLEQQSVTRDPSLVPLRYERMGVSPFTFYRGSAVIMASDLASMPVTGLEVQCIGDAHVGNFGVFMSHTRHLVFDVNDFDETTPGPWEWDVMRLVASVEICGRDRGFSKQDRRDAVRACAKQYRRAMARFAEMGELDVWHAHLDVERMLDEFELDGKTGRTIRKVVEKAREKDSVRAADRLTVRDDGRLRFDSRPPELVPLAGGLSRGAGLRSRTALPRPARSAQHLLWEHPPRPPRPSRPLPPAGRRAQGRGRVDLWGGAPGSRCSPAATRTTRWSCRSRRRRSPSVERYWRPSGFTSHGERVVEGQRLVQSTSDFLLGWTSVPTAGGGTGDCCVPPASGTARARSTSPRWARRASRASRSSARGRSRTRTPAPATRLPSPPTSTTGTPSRTPCGTSPAPTQTRTRSTTRRSAKRILPRETA